MKFMIFTNHSYMLWQFRKELIMKLQTMGEVVLSMPFKGHEDDFDMMGCKCIKTELDRRSINPVKDFKLYLEYKKIIKSERPDMVITYSIKPNIYVGLVCRQKKIPYCANVQGLGTAFQKEPIATIASIMYKVAIKNAKTVFFENQVSAREFVNRHIIPPSQETILNGAGVNLDLYKLQPYPTEREGLHFLFMGRIMKEKGVDELFEAAKYLKMKYEDQVFFDLVGFFEDEYKGIVEELVDNGVIKYYGFQSDPKPYYLMSHCVVLPSYHEGMSNVLLEAAASGRAIIATNIPGCRETIEDGITGYICKKQNVESLINCMERFICLDYESRKTMGIKGRKKMERDFDKKVVVHKTICQIMGEEFETA